MTIDTGDLFVSFEWSGYSDVVVLTQNDGLVTTLSLNDLGVTAMATDSSIVTELNSGDLFVI